MKPKRVCLLFPEFDEGFVMRKVPLGLAYIAASLKRHGHQVEGYNLSCDDFDRIDFRAFDVVGLTCLTPLVNEIRRLTVLIRKQHPDITIVVGGPHPTYNPELVFSQIPLIDFAVTGEGEIAMAELVGAPERAGEIPGVYQRRDGRVTGTPHRGKIDITALPYPDQRVFDHGNLEKRNPFRAIMASRGCPFRCYNCQPMLDLIQPVQLRTPEDVFEEVRFRQETYGETYFGFIDSEFPLKKSWLRRFYDLLRRGGLDFSFHCNSRSDLLDRDIFSLFRKMRISRLAVGVESGVQEIIDKVLHKNIDLEHTRRIFALGQKEMGIRMHGHFMLGIPGETKKDWEKTLDYARRLPAASIKFNMLTPWPGTKFWEICTRKGYLVDDDCSHFNEKRHCYIRTPEFSNHDVEAFYEKIRTTLTADGYVNSRDGSVYFHPEYATIIDQ